MSYGAAKYLTLLSLLFHAGLGCCAHHNHCSAFGMAATPADRTAEVHPSSACSCGHRQVGDHSSDENNNESGGDSCPCGHNHSDCTNHCSWLTVSRVELPSDHDVLLPATMTDCRLSNMTATLIAGSLIGDSQLMSHSGDSLRAATQIWRL
jgi:hypothetical protein